MTHPLLLATLVLALPASGQVHPAALPEGRTVVPLANDGALTWSVDRDGLAVRFSASD